MTDDEVCKKMAELWVACGGDAEGIAWCWKKIQREIIRLQKEKGESL